MVVKIKLFLLVFVYDIYIVNMLVYYEYNYKSKRILFFKIIVEGIIRLKRR